MGRFAGGRMRSGGRFRSSECVHRADSIPLNGLHLQKTGPALSWSACISHCHFLPRVLPLGNVEVLGEPALTWRDCSGGADGQVPHICPGR